ncbi:EMILIN-3-like [Cololabis saira]|uniref:EMILIN-3-like n=1 Tax=Cololabis saira TaxID=129043 RepID=UPI002AD35259|nr:EMILIN-3-like [Cololabis saira]
MAGSPLLIITLFLSLAEAKFYRPFQFHQYKTEPSPHHEPGRPTSRHKNHCAYVIEKTVSFTMQDGAAPYVKAEYNKCSWGQKCPTLMYRLFYKPIYKVAHKTVTELEWRCCPGYSGYNCMEAHPVYQQPIRMMPPFTGPSMKGPQFQEPRHEGPMFNGPMFKGSTMNTAGKANPWSKPEGPPISSFNPYPIPQFGPQGSPSYSKISFEPYPPEPEPEPEPEHQEPNLTDDNQNHEHELTQGPEEMIPAPASGEEQLESENTGQILDGDTKEQIYRMEEDVRRLNQGLETLRGIVTGLEASLRASLREDANRMLSALLSAAPGPLAAPATASHPSTVGFAEIPGGNPDTEGLDGSHVFPGLKELNERVEGLRTELQTKTTELRELKTTVMGHDGALKKISNGAKETSDFRHHLGGSVEDLMDAKLSTTRTEILDELEKRMRDEEGRCKEKIGDERRQCQREQHQQQEKMKQSLQQRASKVGSELENLQAQSRGLQAGDSNALVGRVQQLEASVGNLNQSQAILRVELGGHKDHIEGILEGRLGYVESKLNLTGRMENHESKRKTGVLEDALTGEGLEARMERKMSVLEERLLVALEELGNATAPALLERHAVPTLETELESLRRRLELDVDRVQKQLNGLEILCTSSGSSPEKYATQADSAGPSENVTEAPDLQADRLDSLNNTVQIILSKLTFPEQQKQPETYSPVQAELSVLRFNVDMVNHTLKSLQDSLGTVLHQAGQANSSWYEREARLAQQIKGVVQLVGHQASMLGAGERRLARLKGELQEMKRRLAEEVRVCQNTATVVKKEVTEVGGRVTSVEDQCKGLNYLADDLERIREELERQSNGLLLQVNGTLSSHAQQLSELKGELRNCTSGPKPTQSLQVKEEVKRGDVFTLN